MKDSQKTKQQPVDELVELRRRIGELETLEAEHKEAEERLAKESRATTDVLNDMLRGEVDDIETVKMVLDTCLTATDSVYGMIGVVNEQGKYDTTTYSSKTLQDCAFPEALAWNMSTGMTIRGIWGWPMLHGEPLICNNLQAHPDRVGFPEGHVQLRCFLGVPLKSEGEVVGMVAVANKPGGYTEEDKNTLVRLAPVISVSRQHRLALIAAKRTTAELEQLVAERMKQLQDAKDHLEETVKERTKELRDTQERLVRQEKLATLGQLAGGIGHELRNPLGAIKQAAYFLNMALEETEPEVKETLEILEKEVAISERIISSLLSFARPQPPTRNKVNVNDAIQEVLSRITVPENVKVVKQLDEPLPAILADSVQLGQVFTNITLNAIQAMTEGGQLVVKSEAPSPGWVNISFADSGVGISKEDMGKLFEPLFTTKAKGIGLGLAIVQTLVEGHGGTIGAQSEVGKGSTFTIRLPIGTKKEK